MTDDTQECWPDDILERLRNRYPDVVHPHLLTDAELIGAAVVEIERLRAVGDALADTLRRHVLACGVNDGREAMRAWQEARRER
jgi:hypothetical protein